MFVQPGFIIFFFSVSDFLNTRTKENHNSQTIEGNTSMEGQMCAASMNEEGALGFYFQHMLKTQTLNLLRPLMLRVLITSRKAFNQNNTVLYKVFSKESSNPIGHGEI